MPERHDEGPPRRHFGLLVFCESESQLKLLDDDSAVVIGREPPSEIVVEDPSVSRQHARFILTQGEVWVEDLDSRNGTFLRGRRINRERLESADEVAVGKARVVLAATRPIPTGEQRDVKFGEGKRIIQNPHMRQLYQDVTRAARATLPVLILGETGVGKEHVAASVHREGPRRDKPFVIVNCAAIPASLLETTLFGHERGAFTGAANRTVGLFERANGGVLFLDEVGELASSAQAVLLRAIESRKISRVGSSAEIPIDVRIVAATHCDLQAMVEEGTFRQDLYYRLGGIQLDVPPLRARPEEIEPLVSLFVAEARKEWGALPREVAPDAMDAIRRYSWPGNIRQLRHAVERAALLGRTAIIGVTDLPDYVANVAASPSEAKTSEPPIVELALKEQLRRYERRLIDEALRRAAGNRQVAAKLLRIPLRTLFRKMRAAGAAEEPGGET